LRSIDKGAWVLCLHDLRALHDLTLSVFRAANGPLNMLMEYAVVDIDCWKLELNCKVSSSGAVGSKSN